MDYSPQFDNPMSREATDKLNIANIEGAIPKTYAKVQNFHNCFLINYNLLNSTQAPDQIYCEIKIVIYIVLCNSSYSRINKLILTTISE